MTTPPSPAPVPRRYRHLFARPRAPVWSVKTITIFVLLVLPLTAFFVYTLGHRSLLVETDWFLGLTSTALFTFLTTGLYRGARVKNDLAASDFRPVSLDRIQPDTAPDLSDCPLDLSGDDLAGGILGLLFSLLFAVVLMFAFAFVAELLLNLGLGLAFLLVLALGYVFSRALRRVFARRAACRGRLGTSLAYSAGYTVLYTGWLFALAHVTTWLLAHHRIH